ncbi:MAG: hypothetical protein JXQ66_02525 [Campylobacterales bacterium]|nr:hypothetical protein [Campylobacterales bacterium]
MTKNALLYNESLQISKSMQKCDGNPTQSIVFETVKENDDLKTIIDKNFDQFSNFVSKVGLEIKHYEKTTNYINNSTTILTLKTTCFKVDFNDSFVKIQALK